MIFKTLLNLTAVLLLSLSGLSCTSPEPALSPTTGKITSSVSGEVLQQFPESTWLNSQQAIIDQLSYQPVECLNAEAYASNTYLIDLGKAAFNTPALLGGQAARMGISCNTCHRSGQDNPQFFIAGISDNPGRLDVTHGFFSEVREDNSFNPVAIPTLLNIKDKRSFGTVQPQDSLEAFIQSVIVDEFAGRQPTAEVMQAVMAYILALDKTDCDNSGKMNRDLRLELAFLDKTIDTFYKAIDRGQPDSSAMLMLAAQSQLQSIHHRFVDHPEILADLERMSRELRVGYQQDRNDQLFLADWYNRFNILKTTMLEQSVNSLYQLH